MDNFSRNGLYKLRLRESIKNKSVYSYFKEKYGLVTAGYIMKKHKIGQKRFARICKKYNLNSLEVPAPTSWNTKLYNLKEVEECLDKEA